jgi:hypothetical protein
MPELTPIPVAALSIDTENPRFLDSPAGQREALRESAEHQQGKLVALADDIVKYGLSPIEITMVMRRPGQQERYVVLEGNRRLVALRALERPDVLDGVLPGKMVAELRKLSEQYLKTPIQNIDCYLVPGRDEARHWIVLKHGRELKGAGTEKWGSQEGDRFESRSGLRIHAQILDWLEDGGHITPAERKAVPAASFRRVMENPQVAAKAAVQLRSGKLATTAPAPRVVKVLKKIVNDLATKKIKTKDIYTAEQRRDYADTLPSASTATPVTKQGKSTTPAPQPTPRIVARPAKARDRLLPPECSLNITVPRLSEIVEREFRGLSLEQYSNAVSVLFRVFIELSCDAYIADVAGVDIPPNPNPEDLSLSVKITSVTNDLRKRNKLSEPEALPARRASQHESFLAPSIKNMHQYVHNQFMFPSPGDLRSYWDNLQPFFVALWSVHAGEKKPLASKKTK